MDTDVAEDVDRANTRVITRGRRGGRGFPDTAPSYTTKRMTRRRRKTLADLENGEEVRVRLLARLRAAVECRAEREEEWWRCVMAYFQQPATEREDGWESDRYLPLIFKHVETAAPILIQAIFDPLSPFRFFGATRSSKNIAEALEALVNWQVLSNARGDVAYERMIVWGAIIGTAYLDHGWDFREERRVIPKVVTDPVTGKQVRRMLEAKLRLADNPAVKALNPLDVWQDPNNEPGDDNDAYFLRVRARIGDLRSMAEGQNPHIDSHALEEWLDKAKPWKQGRGLDSAQDNPSFFGAEAWRDWLGDAGMDPGARNPDPVAGTGEETDDEPDEDFVVTMLKYVSKREIITLGDHQHIIGYSENPNAHGKTGIITYQFFEVPDSPYGFGVAKVILGHQEIANENINLWMDTARISLLAPVEVDKSRLSLGDEDFVWEPNKLIRSRGGQAVKRIELPAPTDLALKIDAHLARDADDATGFAAQARGVTPQGGQTATAFTGIQNNLTTRLVLAVRRAARILSQSAALIAKLDQQYLDRVQMVMLRGESAMEYREVKPEEIVGDFTVRASVSAGRIAPEAQLQRLVQLTQTIVPLMQAGALRDPSIARWVRMLLEKADVQDADLLVPKLAGMAKDPLMENAYLETGGVGLRALPDEDHWMHAQAHNDLIAKLEARIAAGEPLPPSILKTAIAHRDEHLQLVALMGSQMAVAGGAAAGPGGAPPPAAGTRAASTGDPVKDGATRAGQRAGAEGTPRVAAPGPGAPVGRPA